MAIWFPAEGRGSVYRAAVAAVCLWLSATVPASALEGFKFVGQHSLEIGEPTTMAAIGEKGFVTYDADVRQLFFLNESFVETGKVALDRVLGYKLKGLGQLIFDTTDQEIVGFDAARKLVMVFSTEGKLLRTMDLGITDPNPLSKPSCIAVDASGLIYVGDPGEDDIKAFSAQGTYLFSMHIPLDVEGDKPNFEPAGIAVLPDGSVAAVDVKMRSMITFARDGRFLLERPLEGDYKEIRKLITLEGGGFLGVDVGAHKIFKWDAYGKLAAALGTRGEGRGQFSELADVICNAKGNVVALDSRNKDVQVFSFQNTTLAFTGETPRPEYSVTAMGTEQTGHDLVALLPDGEILYDAAGKQVVVHRNGKKHVIKHEDFRAVTTAYMDEKKLYLFDRSRRRVFVYRTADYQLDFEFGDSGNGKLDDVVRIIGGADNTLLMADEDDTEVKIFSTDGIFSTSFGKKGKYLPEELGNLRDIALHKGNVAVLDGERNVIHLFTLNGSFLRNVKIQLPTAKADLTALGTDPNGLFVVLDSRNSRVLVLNDNGKATFQFGSRGSRPQDWEKAQDVAVFPDGSVKLFDKGRVNRIFSYTLETPGPLTQVAAAIRNGDWDAARETLTPYLGGKRADAPDLPHAMRLAVYAHEGSDGAFLTPLQLERVHLALRGALKAKPERAENRLALARSLRYTGKLEDAITLLQDEPEGEQDRRCAMLLKTCIKELESSGKASSVVRVVSCKVPVMLAALYQNYYEDRVIELTLANNGGRPTPAGKAFFYARAIMDNPTETTVPAIKPFSKTTVKLRATFNRSILTYVEDTRMAGEVTVRFDQPDGETLLKKNVTFQLLGRNSIDWKQESMMACFITPKDPDVQVFARQAMKTAEDQTIQSDLDQHLFKALTLFDAMQSIGIYYVPDPRQPFNFSDLSEGGRIDYLQFPRETLLRQSGDCDDLSALYASLLEGSGIPAVLVTSPGHIFVAFALARGKDGIDALGLSSDLLIKHKGDYYVPVETTMLGNPFISAWRVAANTIAKHKKDKNIGIIDLKDAWKTYHTVSLPPSEKNVPVPKKSVLSALLKRELDALNLRQVEKRLAVFKRWLKREPKKLSLLMLLARSYAEVGMFDLAGEYAERARKVDPGSADVYQALGNLAYMQNDCTKAVELYKKADSIDHSAATQLNLALAYLKDGKLMPARKAYGEAKKLDSELVKEYPELGQLLE